MTNDTTSTDDTEQCPECGSEVSEKNPMFDWWMCDDCEIAFNDDGEVTAR